MLQRSLSRSREVNAVLKRIAPCSQRKKQSMSRLSSENCPKIDTIFKGNSITQNNEKYFTLTKNWKHKLYVKDPKQTPQAAKLIARKKYEAKVLVWLVGSEKGLLKPLIAKSGLAISTKHYMN